MEIISREAWGAREPAGPPHKIALYQPLLILHHAAGAVVPGDDRVSASDLNRVNAIQDFHIDGRGWRDIAYNFLADPDGNIFEGRGVGVANGATKGYGASSYAICVIGNFDKQEPESDLLEGLAEFVAYGHEKGWWPDHFTGGHRDYGSTSCPGSRLYPQIGQINALAKEATMGLSAEQEALLRSISDQLDKLPAQIAKATTDRVMATEMRSGEYTRTFVQSVLRTEDLVRAWSASEVAQADLDAAVDELIRTLPKETLALLRSKLA